MLTMVVLAVFLGLGAMLVTRRLMSKPAAAEEESQEILVAARDFKEVAARAKGPLSLSLRGVNDHDIVDRPKPKPEVSEEEKARRAKLEKELEELKLALAKKLAEPPPPAPKPPEPRPPQMRFVYIYRPLQNKKAGEYPERVAVNEAAQKIAKQRLNSDDDEPSSFGFGTTTVHQGRP